MRQCGMSHVSQELPQWRLTLKKYCQSKKIGRRHEQTLMLSLLIFMSCCTKVDMSVCIVAMTDPSASPNGGIRTYNWTDKSLVLSAFLWGYMWPQVFAGWLANRYGPKWFLISAMTTCSLIGLLLPTMADAFGSSGVMACRTFQGLCQGWVFPSVQALLGKWVPRDESSRLGSFVHAGGPTGILVGTLVSGYIASSWYGWPMVFYVFYSTMMLWCILFAHLGSNSPAKHPKITTEERLYIETSLNQEEYSEGRPGIKVPGVKSSSCRYFCEFNNMYSIRQPWNNCDMLRILFVESFSFQSGVRKDVQSEVFDTQTIYRQLGKKYSNLLHFGL
ncbi:hypothetical protein JTB14_015183 [Gonioctena quinquepunctata]|nr:hypothetical protein JTB14_015183 [Gonioctena quinquepunctata]